LKTEVDAELKKYESLIAKKYPEDLNASIMMNPKLIKEKNEILRKVKLQRMERDHLPDFKRKLTEDILSERQIEERKRQEEIFLSSLKKK